jgi:hypothetical protein
MKSTKYNGLQIRIPHFREGIFTFYNKGEKDKYDMIHSNDSEFIESHDEDLITRLINEGTWIPVNSNANNTTPIYEIY